MRRMSRRRPWSGPTPRPSRRWDERRAFLRPSETLSANLPAGSPGGLPASKSRMLQPPATTATILIIDDQESNLRLLEGVLISAGYQASSARPIRSRRSISTGSTGRTSWCSTCTCRCWTVSACSSGSTSTCPKAPTSRSSYHRRPEPDDQAAGALGRRQDFLGKPFDPLEVVLRSRTCSRPDRSTSNCSGRTRCSKRKSRSAATNSRTRSSRFSSAWADRGVPRRRHDAAHAAGRAISARIAEPTGLPDDLVKTLRLAAPLHDIGKIGVPDNILLKLGKLTQEEYDVIKTHTAIGARILSGSTDLLLQMAEPIALTHHERWDGHGYIGGLRGEEIPLVSRIVAVADVFDALTHQRPYKDPWPVDDAIHEIEHQSGQQFDPEVVAALRQILEEDAAGDDDSAGPGSRLAAGPARTVAGDPAADRRRVALPRPRADDARLTGASRGPASRRPRAPRRWTRVARPTAPARRARAPTISRLPAWRRAWRAPSRAAADLRRGQAIQLADQPPPAPACRRRRRRTSASHGSCSRSSAATASSWVSTRVPSTSSASRIRSRP